MISLLPIKSSHRTAAKRGGRSALHLILAAGLVFFFLLSAGRGRAQEGEAAAPAPATAPAAAAPDAAAPPAAEGEDLGHSTLAGHGGWIEKLKEGRETAAVQIGLSIFGLAFALERFVNLRRKKVVPAGLSAKARMLWNEGRFEELEELGEKEPSTLSRVISFIVRHRDAPTGEVSVMAGDMVSQEMSVAAQRAYPLGVVATLEPLLGLLGMILGMIRTFEVVALAGALGDPTQLASGISEALVTTGLGLAIAIPFLALHHYFKHRIGMFTALLEKELTDLMVAWLMRRPGTGPGASASGTATASAHQPAHPASAAGTATGVGLGDVATA